MWDTAILLGFEENKYEFLDEIKLGLSGDFLSNYFEYLLCAKYQGLRGFCFFLCLSVSSEAIIVLKHPKENTISDGVYAI